MPHGVRSQVPSVAQAARRAVDHCSGFSITRAKCHAMVERAGFLALLELSPFGRAQSEQTTERRPRLRSGHRVSKEPMPASSRGMAAPSVAPGLRATLCPNLSVERTC